MTFFSVFIGQDRAVHRVAGDELCSHVGHILVYLDTQHSDIIADLEWLHRRYDHYKALIEGRREGFVLPQGPVPVPQLHLARSAAKKVIRVMVRLEDEFSPFRSEHKAAKDPCGSFAGKGS